MKCEICGSEFTEAELVDGNKCPICGEPVNYDNESEEFKGETKELDNESEEFKGETELGNADSLMGLDRSEVKLEEKEDKLLENESESLESEDELSKKMIEVGLTASKFSRLVENGNKLPKEEESEIENVSDVEDNESEIELDETKNVDETNDESEVKNDESEVKNDELEKTIEESEVKNDESEVNSNSDIEDTNASLNDNTEEKDSEADISNDENLENEEDELDREIARLEKTKIADIEDLDIAEEIPESPKKEEESSNDFLEETLINSDSSVEKKKFSLKNIKNNLRFNKKLSIIILSILIVLALGAFAFVTIYMCGWLGNFGIIPEAI